MRCLVVRGCWNSAGTIDLASKASVRRASVRTLPVSESSISASLEVMFVVLLKEMSKGQRGEREALNSSYERSPQAPPRLCLF